MIHPSAVIDPAARLGNNVSVGAYSVIGADVEIAPQWERSRTAARLVWITFGGVAAIVGIALLVAQATSAHGSFASAVAFAAVLVCGMGGVVPWLVATRIARRARREWNALAARVQAART